jgi:hypothetical protein
MTCKPDGSAYEVSADCALDKTTCDGGLCSNPCDGIWGLPENAGCEFYALDLDNVVEMGIDAQIAQFSVVVANTSQQFSSDVVVTRPDGELLTASLPPLGLHQFDLPADWGLDGTVKAYRAFHVQSSRPVIAYQFNPAGNVGVFSNDASLLLPVARLANVHRVIAYGQLKDPVGLGDEFYRGFFAVVGVASGKTVVTFTPTIQTLSGEGIPAVKAGESHTVSLMQGEVLNVESDSPGGDLTGTLVEASGPVAVFGGHEATLTAGVCCADHIEEQVIPLSLWGKRYLVARSVPRWLEKDHVRILASNDQTHVTLTPPVAELKELQAGQFASFQTNQDVEISSDQPILVAQFLASSYEALGKTEASGCGGPADCPVPFTCDGAGGLCIGPTCSEGGDVCPSGTTCVSYEDFGVAYCEPVGDPAMFLAIPVELYLDRYVFLIPSGFKGNFVSIIIPVEANSVLLDGVPIPKEKFVGVGTGEYAAYRGPVAEGVHSVSSDRKISVLVYGYDKDVSYAYPAGMAILTQNP